jgi:hypothetical protein
MADETERGDALDQEREMREHEAEARRRSGDEQSGDSGDSGGGGAAADSGGGAGRENYDELPGAGAGDPEHDESHPAPPGSVTGGGGQAG